MPQPGETWVVTGASKGIGLAYVTQVSPLSAPCPNEAPAWQSW